MRGILLKTHLPKIYLAFGLLGIGVVLSACQTLSKEECVAADWTVIGETDGTAGYAPQERFARHAKACAKAGITPDQTAWNQGYQTGLIRYCTPANGLRVGEAGNNYANVCPLDKSAAFLSGYNLGKRAHDIRSDINARQSAISSRQAQAAEKIKLIATATPTEQTTIQLEIANLNQQNSTDQSEIARLSGELALAERDIQNFRVGLGN